MIDLAFAAGTGVVWIVLLAWYALHARHAGPFRSERVESVGGTVLVGANIMNATYWGLAPLVRIGITANMISWIALALGVAAGAAIGIGWFGLACALATASTLCDILDGQVARLSGSGSPQGVLLDSVIDRYADFAFIAGFAVFAHESRLQVAVSLFALLASSMISYVSAKADALGVSVPRGLMRRHERAAFLTLGAGLALMLGPTIQGLVPALPATTTFLASLALVGVVGNVAAVHRLVRIAKVLRQRHITDALPVSTTPGPAPA